MLKHPTSCLRGGRQHSSTRSSMKPGLLLRQQKFNVFSMQQWEKDLKMIRTVTCHPSCYYCISCHLLREGRRPRSVQQRLLIDLCISTRAGISLLNSSFVLIKNSCTSIEDHHSGRQSHQPYLLGLGRIKSRIDNFYVVVDKHLIPCAGTSSLSAIDELFKVHYVFKLSYEEALVNRLQSTTSMLDFLVSLPEKRSYVQSF
ncbi:uncharacterized protein [Misgurnus anguillicaudatus]|uniref:uncharacterized protein n=1 Tax=Misgurnus anguillicaudatus TaxID=75329 RepID=UPI003CCFD4F5